MMGHPPSAETIYARELGLTSRVAHRTIKLMGGVEKLKSLSPEVRALLLKQTSKAGKSGLTARGMKRAKDIRIREEV